MCMCTCVSAHGGFSPAVVFFRFVVKKYMFVYLYVSVVIYRSRERNNFVTRIATDLLFEVICACVLLFPTSDMYN